MKNINTNYLLFEVVDLLFFYILLGNFITVDLLNRLWAYFPKKRQRFELLNEVGLWFFNSKSRKCSLTNQLSQTYLAQVSLNCSNLELASYHNLHPHSMKRNVWAFWFDEVSLMLLCCLWWSKNLNLAS